MNEQELPLAETPVLKTGLPLASIFLGVIGSCTLVTSPVMFLDTYLGLPLTILGFLLGFLAFFLPKQHKLLALIGVTTAGISLFLFLAFTAWLLA
jgi:hypothetical protein